MFNTAQCTQLHASVRNCTVCTVMTRWANEISPRHLGSASSDGIEVSRVHTFDQVQSFIFHLGRKKLSIFYLVLKKVSIFHLGLKNFQSFTAEISPKCLSDVVSVEEVRRRTSMISESVILQSSHKHALA